MPPDRGAIKKTSNTRDLKKDSKGATSRRDVKQNKIEESTRSVRRSVQESPKKDVSPSRTKEVRRKDNAKPVANERITSKMRVDMEKMRDVRDVSKDLSKIKQSLAKNRVSRNSPLQTPTRPMVPKAASVGSVYDRLAAKNSPAPTKKVPNVPRAGTIKQNLSASKSVPTTIPKRTSSIMQKPNTERNVKKPERIENNKTSSKGKEASQVTRPAQKLSRERTRTRTLSPNEIKIARGEPSPQKQSSKSSSNQENKSSAGKLEDKYQGYGDVASTSKESDKEDDYEDDFEEYESDFEEDIPEESSEESSSPSDLVSISDESSLDESDAEEAEVVEMASRPVVEEEKKLDSGNYDLTENKKKGKELQQIKEALEKEYVALSSQRSRGNVSRQNTIATDEGFEEEKGSESRPSSRAKPVGFFNFANARKRMEEQNVSAKARRRGEEVLSMITLDTVTFSLLDLAPVSYEVYMKSYGRSNTVQVHVQTNDDNISEEVQCEEIVSKNKWTQHPVTFHPVTDKTNSDAYYRVFIQDRLGCGGDEQKEDPNAWKQYIKYDTGRLNQFILQRGQYILQLLEQRSPEIQKKLVHTTKGSSVTSGYTSLAVDSVSFLAGRPVSSICFSHNCSPTLVATVHNRISGREENSEIAVRKSMICVWNTLQPSYPRKVLMCAEEATASSFDAGRGNFVICGLCDGAVCLWDLRETISSHRVLYTDSDGWVLFSPTYSTAEILKNEGHLTKVIAVEAVPNSVSSDEFSPQQVCTLEAQGLVIVWTIVQSAKIGVKSGLAQEDLGLAHWGRVRLVRSIAINSTDSFSLDNHLLSSLECRDLKIDPLDPNHFYVCTNTGHIIHCLINGGKPHPRIFSSTKGVFTPATYIEHCSFDQPFFLVGFEGGSIRLYGHDTSRPLAAYGGDELGLGYSVRALQWLSTCPNVFFALDASSRIHVWDLSISDIHPIDTLHFDKQILAMRLSQDAERKQEFLAIVTADGKVQLHHLKSELVRGTKNTFEEQLRIFLLYTSAL